MIPGTTELLRDARWAIGSQSSTSTPTRMQPQRGAKASSPYNRPQLGVIRSEVVVPRAPKPAHGAAPFFDAYDGPDGGFNLGFDDLAPRLPVRPVPQRVEDREQREPEVESNRFVALVGKALPFLSIVGSIAGIQEGMGWRAQDFVAHDKILPALCSANNQVALTGICLLSGALALFPVLQIIRHAIVESNYSYRQSPGDGWVRSFVEASGILDRGEGTARWIQALTTVGLVAFAAFAASTTPMAVMTIGIAMGVSSLAASNFGSDTKLQKVAGCVAGVINAYFLAHTAYACQIADESLSAIGLGVGACVAAYAAVRGTQVMLNLFGPDWTQQHWVARG